MKIQVEAFDGSMTDKYLDPLPCGGVPTFDHDSGYAYRCDTCGAVIGSLAMPTDCNEAWREQIEKEKVWEMLEKR